MAENEGSYRNSDVNGPGLDMTHGFVHHIRKNQINRDDYDKEVKLAKLNQRPPRRTPAPTRPRKPDLNRYMPPTKKSNGDEAPAMDELVLFKLEYEDEDGGVSKLLVLKGDDPYEIASEFGHDCGIQEALIEALAWRIEQEMKKRGA